ncbi:outer membrane efflux protein (plasmid) [Sphingopyxis fribergensis]|uniref:Outer membrane efflux protein n=1 Tax=Sphingopyxis fribergensis TaxID=1515612 RepID=A0A0A7PP53_9SPHN|nr:TolC family protein [Sphingopyxis fribergensis]AJA11759.1 outer membrane efflux protein [Sphingopyxis fribergensis]
MIRRVPRRGCFTVALAAILAGCTIAGPNYVPPEPLAGIADRPNSAFEASSSPALADVPMPSHWWRLYNDPRLDALVEQALAANTDLRAAAANLERAHAVVREVRAAAGAQATVEGGPSVGQTTTLGVAPSAGIHSQIDAGVGISYQVDVVGRIRRAIEAANAGAEAQAAALDLTRTTVAADVVGAYTNACAAGAQIDVAQQSLNLQRRSLALTERGVRGGVFAPLDAVRSRTLAAQLAATLPPLEANRRVALYQLAVLTGKAPTDYPAELATCTAMPHIDRPLPIGDGAALIRRRPDIRQAERQLAAATATIGVETADLYPSISIGASAGTTSRRVSGLLSSSALRFNVGPLISWTFPNRGVARARIAQANAAAKAALAGFDGTVLTALREAESALTVYVRDLDENAQLRVARDQSRKAAGIQRRLSRGGTVSGLEALDVERTLATAESALAASDAKLASDRVAIFLALGGGWEADAQP